MRASSAGLEKHAGLLDISLMRKKPAASLQMTTNAIAHMKLTLTVAVIRRGVPNREAQRIPTVPIIARDVKAINAIASGCC